MNELPIASTRRSSSPRIARVLGAGVALVGAALAMSASWACGQCAVGCLNQVHMVVHGHTNALNADPDPLFEVCGANCTTFHLVGTSCKVVGSDNGNTCEVTTAGLEFDVNINAVEEDFVYMNVKTKDDVVIFNDNAKVTTTEVEVCGETCHEGEVEFTIPQ